MVENGMEDKIEGKERINNAWEAPRKGKEIVESKIEEIMNSA